MRYERHIFVCVNEREPDHPRGCCKKCGGERVRDALKKAVKERGLHGKVRVNKAGCLDVCEYGAAAVVYPEGIWYGGLTEQDVEELVESHLTRGIPVKRLLIPHKRYTPEDLLDASEFEHDE